MVMYALNEVQVSWKQLLSSLGFEEQVIKTPEKTPNNKTRVSKKAGSSSKSVVKNNRNLFLWQYKLD
jgi:hypothetical protein